MINLIDLLKTKSISFDNYKIHLATGVEHPPLNAFLEVSYAFAATLTFFNIMSSVLSLKISLKVF